MSLPDQDGADERPWDRPGAVRRDRQPHRGAFLQLLGGGGAVLGLLAILCGVAAPYSPFAPLLAGGWLVLSAGVSGWVLWAGGRDLALMRRGAVDPAGKGATEAARSLGLWGLVAALLAGLALASTLLTPLL